jgi:hypothetical protein
LQKKPDLPTCCFACSFLLPAIHFSLRGDMRRQQAFGFVRIKHKVASCWGWPLFLSSGLSSFELWTTVNVLKGAAGKNNGHIQPFG